MKFTITFDLALRTSEDAHDVEAAIVSALETALPEALATALDDDDLCVDVCVTDVGEGDSDDVDEDDEEEDFDED